MAMPIGLVQDRQASCRIAPIGTGAKARPGAELRDGAHRELLEQLVQADACGYPLDITVLHIGDHDPSGVHVHASLDEDLRAFVAHYGGRLETPRLAVTPEQVERYALPTAPPKATDGRSFEGLTTQCEALPPDTLATILRDAIEQRQDAETRRAVIEREHDEREQLRERFELVA